MTKRTIGAIALLMASCAEPVPERKAVQPMDPPPQAQAVTIVEVAADGAASAPVSVLKFVLPDAEWHQRLTPLGYAVTRQKATEVAFTGKYDKHYAPGVYRCVGCNTALFHSSAKFDSGTGWPSFTAPVAAENVYVEADDGRDEVLCRRCDAHLGHVFPDGPEPTRLRYCMNSAALRFEAGPHPRAE